METENNFIQIENVNKKQNNLSSSKIIALFIVTVIISLLVGAGALLLVFHYFPDFARDTVNNITKTESKVTVTDTGIADAVEKIYDAVVVVKTYQRNQVYSTGTGFIYKKEGNKYYILTNYHVIQGGDNINVVFTNDNEVKVTVLGGDKYSDVAVLSYETSSDLKVAELGSSERMRVGDTVFAIGAPLDSTVYSWSVTRGILSGKDREVEVSVNSTYGSDYIMQVLQTDSALNSGNSGGPLCNSNGQVIGITNMKLVISGVEGMGFAIPIEEATSYADALINGEDLSKPYLGISMIEGTNEYYARQYGVSPTEGVLLGSVEAFSSAAKAGLQQGDIIIGINSVDVTGIASLRYQLYKYRVGETIVIKYIRDGRTSTTKLTLASG